MWVGSRLLGEEIDMQGGEGGRRGGDRHTRKGGGEMDIEAGKIIWAKGVSGFI